LIVGGSTSSPTARVQKIGFDDREVLALMAERRTNIGIARRLWLTERTIETHVASILVKLGLHADDEDHRRVLAVLTFLNHRRLPVA